MKLPTFPPRILPYLTGGLGDSKIVEGTKNLLNDAMKVMLVIIPIAGGLLVAFFALRMAMSDEHDKISWKKRITVVIICTIIGLLASTIITVITGYYT